MTCRKIFDGLLSYISETMMPIIPLLIASGLVSAGLTAAQLLFDADTSSPVFMIGSALSQNALYFMPVFIGYSAAKALGASPLAAAFLGLFLVSPQFEAAAEAAGAAGLFGLPFPVFSYPGTVFPMLIGTWVFSKIEPAVDRAVPALVRSVLSPFFSILIMVILLLFAIGPAGCLLGTLIGETVLTVQSLVGFFGCGILAAAQSFLMILGIHTVTAPVMTELLNTLGYDSLVRPSLIANCFAVFGGVLAAAARSKNRAKRDEAVGIAVSTFFGTPAAGLYSIALPYRTPLIGMTVGSFAGGCLASWLGARSYAMGSNGIFGLLVFAETLPAMLAASLAAFFISFGVTFALGGGLASDAGQAGVDTGCPRRQAAGISGLIVTGMKSDCLWGSGKRRIR